MFTKQAHGSATKDTMLYVHWLPAVVGIASVSMDDAERIVGRDRLSRWYGAGESVEIAAMSLRSWVREALKQERAEREAAHLRSMLALGAKR